MWDMLRQQGIHLTEISTDILDKALLVYLASYSGLERLTIWNVGDQESNQLADYFFGSVLPGHAQSLLELSCSATYEGKWNLDPYNAEVISQLYRLENLLLSVDVRQSNVVVSPSTLNLHAF
ncbi:hypothetical protein DFH07DRAFT_749814 [Mycena maculata]|uniref:Uncharacterized protein n=1 Tax=Mycena maculata TaxID=230809 RepID=A0AAD7N488_9AGAR|nr:hypothetical protein DFH07DRAFT_749814 [Mycena maculata]